MEEWVETYQSENERLWHGYDRLKELDFVVLDNSVRESTVGQLRGHTSEDKFKIFDEATKCGFKVCPPAVLICFVKLLLRFYTNLE